MSPRPGLMLLHAASGAVRADVPVGDSQGISRFGYGHFWTVGEDGIMTELDPRSGALVRSIPVGVQPGGIAVGAGGIWVTDRNDPTLLRIDPVTGQVDLRARLSTRGLRGPEPNGGVAFDAGSLWVARGPEAVDRLDPVSLKLQHRIRVDRRGCGAGSGAQCALAAGGGRVWETGGNDGWLARIDEAIDHLAVMGGLRPYVCCVAVGGGSVWVAEAHDIARLASDGRPTRRYPVSSAAIGDMAFDGRSLWATADTTGQLLRIDARTGRLRSLRLGGLLIGTAASRGIVAVSALPLPVEPTRGLGRRVLRVGLGRDWLNPTDPAVTRRPSGSGRWQWQLHHTTCAELYARPASPGESPQPELASGPPQPSSGGRIWTIPIRGDLRFSPPLNRAVTAEDVRATIVRSLSPELGPAAPAAAILRDVVGLSAYRRGATNDVSGIALRHGRLQITTRDRVRNLAARLALPYFCVLPAGTPAPPGGYEDPLPTAGPYYLASHEGGTLAVLKPNPGYRGPRPPLLSAIVFHMNVPDQAGTTQVQDGQLDYFDGGRSLLSARLGCRTDQPGVPGLDLAALCLRSAAS